jgi:hypothetical protein
MTLADLIADRRAKIEAFETDTRENAFHDISEVNDLIARTPIASKADALAALDLIRDETSQPGHHLVIAMIAALRSYIEKD